MTNPFPNEPGTNPPRYPKRTDTAKWIWALTGAVVVLLLGLFFVGNLGSRTPAANPPAVTAVPAPATNVPPPAPEQTTGQSAPRAQ
jgi:drug/metabolite transporter (DMT)-like permease